MTNPTPPARGNPTQPPSQAWVTHTTSQMGGLGQFVALLMAAASLAGGALLVGLAVLFPLLSLGGVVVGAVLIIRRKRQFERRGM